MFPFNLLPPPRHPARPIYWLAIGAAMAIGALYGRNITGPLWLIMLVLVGIGLAGGLLIDRLFPNLRDDPPARPIKFRYQPRQLPDSDRWAVLDTDTDDFLLIGPQDNLRTWTGTPSQAVNHAAALNRQEAQDATSP